ncbi:MAG: histidine kinase [Thermomicrobiales bacterium]
MNAPPATATGTAPAPPPASTARGRGGRERPPAAWLGRGLRYGLLALYAGSVYTLVVTRGGLTGARTLPPWWLSLLGVLAAAATSVPVHAWLAVHLDRLLTGWHDDPYAVLSAVRQHLDHKPDPTPAAILPTVAATIAATLQLPYIAIEMGLGAATSTVAYGTAPPLAERLTIPLTYHGAVVGALHAAARRPGEVLSADDLRLLRDLASQVGITLHAARLSDALQTAREQFVTTREEERRRIRRDLHDSLGPTLASLRMQLGAVRNVLRERPEMAETMIDELRDDVREATATIRHLVYGLRPPLLDEHGLAGALRSLDTVAAPATLMLELPATLPPLSAALEVALYRIAAEAVHNVARHAHASCCTVRLELATDAVLLTIRDDGVGLPAEHNGGIGLTSMRERAAELGGTLTVAAAPGGGACVSAQIPWRH